MSLPNLPKVQKLQEALHAKAKGSPDFRFYTLYDKLYRDDVLYVAYRRCLINGGAAGVDGQTFEDIEAYGEKRWRDVETEHGMRLLRHKRGNPDTDSRRSLNHRATSRLYPLLI